MLRIFVCLCSLVFSLQSVIAAPADDLAALIDDYWSNEMEENPFQATGAGVHDYNDRVPAVAPEDHARRARQAAAFLSRLEAIDRSGLNESDRVNADLLTFILKHKVALAAFDPWRIPFLADTGFHTNFSYTVNATPFRNEADYEAYLKRLSALPAYIDQHIANMRQGLADGFTQPKEIMENILPSFDAQVKETPEAHPYFAPFKKFPATISDRKKKALTKRGREVLAQSVTPAYAKLAAFMRDEYMPNARETLGISATPNGEAYYAAVTRFYTSLDDASPDEIHELGLKEVARIRKEMAQVIEDAGFDGSFEEFLEFLRTDRQFYAESPQRLLERAAWIAKDIDGRLPGYFGKLPRQPYSVEPVPEDIAPNYTNARYVGAPLDSDRGGQSWVNTYNHEIRPLYQLVAMALHEGVPGHHLQSALSKEIENVPDFRQGFYPHAYGEGWGLYSEKLGVEMGVYQTPFDHFGRLTWEMWRACRLVIDTGLHVKGWTRDQAVDYLASNTALSLHNVNTEIDRYIAWPGQALSYKMGELTIWELRAKAERELGDEFDIRTFHDAVLVQGGLPLDMLRAQIDAYIKEEKKKP
ncbi:MAG: DUF885 domain-containing protein [Pseudomonadota bacterium]